MPLNFNLDFAGPKIDIVTREVPIAAIEKVGDILQDRYDKSYEQYNMFQELAKQTEQIADPLQKETVRNYITSLEPEIKSISERGDFHNMRHQTAALARSAANNLKLFENQAQQAAKIREEISKAEKINDPVKKQYYENQLAQQISSTKFDPERKVFQFQPLTTPKMVSDFDFTKLAFSAAEGWKADAEGYTSGNLKVVNAPVYDKNGNLVKAPGVYDVTTGQKISEVKAPEVYNNLLKVIKSSPGAMESLNEDVNVYMWKNQIPEENRQQVYDKIFKEKVLGAVEAASQKESFKQKERVYDEKFASEGAQKAYGFGQQPSDNQPFWDEYVSTMNPGEQSAMVSDVAEKAQGSWATYLPGRLYEFNLKEDYKPKVRLLFSGLSVANLEKMKNGTPEQQKLYNELNQANVYSVYNKVRDNKPIGGYEWLNIMRILKDNNYVPPTAYKWVSTSDTRLLQELKRTDPSVVSADGRVDTEKAQQALNRRVFGNNQGLVIDKDGKFTAGNAEGYDIMNPETGEAISLKEAIEKNKWDINQGKIFDKSNTIQVNGRVLPGSLAHAHSENAQQDLSYFGAGYPVNVGGKQFIVAKRGPDTLNSNAAKINDLASFARFGRSPKEYRTTDGKIIKVSSDFSGNVIVEGNGKKSAPISPDNFNRWLEGFNNSSNIKYPVTDYLQILLNQ